MTFSLVISRSIYFFNLFFLLHFKFTLSAAGTANFIIGIISFFATTAKFLRSEQFQSQYHWVFFCLFQRNGVRVRITGLFQQKATAFIVTPQVILLNLVSELWWMKIIFLHTLRKTINMLMIKPFALDCYIVSFN